MKIQNYMKLFVGMLGITLTLSGCKFVREIDVPPNIGHINVDDGNVGNRNDGLSDNIPITENPVTIVVENRAFIDEEAVLEYFYGQSKEELQKAGYLEEKISSSGSHCISFECLKDGMELSYIYEHGKNRNVLYFMDMREAAGSRYEDVLEDKFIDNEISKRLMEMYPEEELENCSKEEAIAICAPVAEVCGYGDALVNVYVMKHEVLNNYAQEVGIMNTTHFRNAPDPEYDYNYVHTLQRKISSATKTEDTELLVQLLTELSAYNASDDDKRIEWTEKHDAYLLVYQTQLNGRILDSMYYNLICIYVPAYERIVYMKADCPLVVTETLEEVPLVTQEEAVEEMLRVLKISSMDDITITSISMVYSPRYEQADHELERRTIDPCWRIDYELSENLREQPLLYNDDDGTIFINAIDGRENKYPRG